MAKGNLILPNGTKVNIEGTVEEVSLLLTKFSQSNETTQTKNKRRNKKKSATYKNASQKTGPTSLITELSNEGYFKSKRSLGDIQKKLEERGHIYAQTSLSPILTRLTRKRVIRRIKEKKKGWVYVN